MTWSMPYFVSYLVLGVFVGGQIRGVESDAES